MHVAGCAEAGVFDAGAVGEPEGRFGEAAGGGVVRAWRAFLFSMIQRTGVRRGRTMSGFGSGAPVKR